MMPRLSPRPPSIPGQAPPWPHPPPQGPGHHSGGRFLIVDYAHSWSGNTLYVAVATDIPCHMWLRWTAVEMQVHMHTKRLRGLDIMGDPKFCFVEWLEVEQTEEGDTSNHSFSFPGWAVGEQRWWHFRATEEEVASPSTTGIFTAVYEVQKAADSLLHTDALYKDPFGLMDHFFNSVPGQKLQYPFTFPQMVYTPAQPPTEPLHVANKAYVDSVMGG